jgi:outer membrane protein OmpA-like peptidoglycan-associated protein
MKHAISRLVWLPLGALVAAGCASSAPSTHLENARSQYERARNSQASQLVPAQLHEAKKALDEAELAHADDPRSYEEESLAYVAYRKAELAMSAAREYAARNTITGADAMYEAKQGQLLDQANQLAETREQQLERERKARLEAQKRASAALASLAELAKVKEEAQRTIITLDGSVLFETGKSTLLALAQDKLRTVAKSLEDMDPDAKIVVAGHTDSRGTDENNLLLSRSRAEAVSQFLGQNGIDPSRITAEGRGEAQPIASNDTPEGRANNRRVEIIIQHGEERQSSSQSSLGPR